MEPNSNIKWFLTKFYGQPETSKKKESWSPLAQIWSLMPIGVSYAISMRSNERFQRRKIYKKDGGRLRPKKHMKDFKETL